ncbi:hypothetical protein DL93DRAFT_2226844 [Clavulina sp. PMI_390]|nr:hypothetical protein DL93DRAFT_2226844 [Clavulina sp. PMI_390]
MRPRPETFKGPLDKLEGPLLGQTLLHQSPSWYFGLELTSTESETARCRMQRVLEIHHRLHAREHQIHALEIAQPVRDCPANEFISMSMTSGGEVLVVGLLSGLIVVDLRYKTKFTLQLAHSDTHHPYMRKMVTAMSEYEGAAGVLIAGKLIDDSKISILFQELPQHETPLGVPNYVILLDIPVPPPKITSMLKIARGYLFFITMVTDPAAHSFYEVNAFNLCSKQTITVVHTDLEIVQDAEVVDDQLFLCFYSGHIGQHRLKREAEHLTSHMYRIHSHSEAPSQHIYCNFNVDALASDQGDYSLEFRCWRLLPSYTVTKSLTVNLIASPVGVRRPGYAPPPPSMFPKFTFDSSHFPPMNTEGSPTHPSSLSRLTSRLRNSREYFIHRCSQAGQSTLLSQIRLRDGDADVFMLSYAPQAGLNGGRGRETEPWMTRYKAVHLENREGISMLFTASAKQKEFVRDFLWNEWTGNMVIASVNAASAMLTVAIYRM